MSLLGPKYNVPLNALSYVDTTRPTLDADSFFSDSVVFNTYQVAVKSTLELLGTRISPVPVILSITAAPDTMSAVLRSGAQPVLLDVDVSTLQLNATQLQEALSELEAAVVVLNMPGGQTPDKALLDLVEDLPTVVDTRLLPDELQPLGSFTIYDLTAICGGGGLVYHTFEKQQQELRTIRNGLMGHSADLSWPQVLKLKTELSNLSKLREDQEKAASAYQRVLRKRNKSGMIVFEDSEDWPYYLVRVPDAARVVAHLQAEGIDAQLACYPLHFLPEMAARWAEPPEYEAAEMLHTQLVALPTTPFIIQNDEYTGQRMVEIIVDLMLEVV